MINILFKHNFIIIIVASIFLSGCKFKQAPVKPEPVIKKVQANDDLSKALGVHLVKYEYDLQGLNIPSGMHVYLTTWVELLQEDTVIKQWSTPNNIIGKSGSILFPYYKPPLFKNEQKTIEGKLITDGNAMTSMDISLDVPFNTISYLGGKNEEVLELDTEYTLATLVEFYSPHAMNKARPPNLNSFDESENKALILKAKFGLINE